MRTDDVTFSFTFPLIVENEVSTYDVIISVVSRTCMDTRSCGDTPRQPTTDKIAVRRIQTIADGIDAVSTTTNTGAPTEREKDPGNPLCLLLPC